MTYSDVNINQCQEDCAIFSIEAWFFDGNFLRSDSRSDRFRGPVKLLPGGAYTAKILLFVSFYKIPSWESHTFPDKSSLFSSDGVNFFRFCILEKRWPQINTFGWRTERWGVLVCVEHLCAMIMELMELLWVFLSMIWRRRRPRHRHCKPQDKGDTQLLFFSTPPQMFRKLLSVISLTKFWWLVTNIPIIHS